MVAILRQKNVGNSLKVTYIRLCMEMHDRKAKAIVALLSDLFEISAVYRQSDRLMFSLSFRFEHKRSLEMIKDRLQTAGYDFRFDEGDDGLLLDIDPNTRVKIPFLNVVLFVVTLFSVYVVATFFRFLWTTPTFVEAYQGASDALASGKGLVFAVALISILLVHEMGHYIASRRRNIVTSWPFFIPAPSLIGSFGAVIISKSPFWNRRDMIEVGAAGPIIGWIVALAWLWYGLSQSAILPLSAFQPGEIPFSLEGESLLMRAATSLLVGAAPEGSFYRLSEAAFAGWVGLLVTAINMLPIGMLDGGHVVYGLARKRQHIMGKLATAGLVVLGFFAPMWFIFVALVLFFGMSHPPTLDDRRPLSRTATLMGWIALGILVLSFTPVPFR